MKCDLHVHTVHSGMCTIPVLRRIARESYTDPAELYAQLKRGGMDLVTVTDHDSIEAAEPLRGYPDFFLSEEVTVRMPSGTELHAGVYDITERQHIEIQRRRNDLPALVAYLSEKRLLFSANHIYSSLAGQREVEDFAWFAEYFPAVETRNGHMLARANRRATQFAALHGLAAIAGSDAHALPSAGTAWTEVRGARNKHEFLAAVARGQGFARGQSGCYAKLTRDVFLISAAAMLERKWLLPLAPVAAAILPVWTLANYALEWKFARRWSRARKAAHLLPAPWTAQAIAEVAA